MGETDRETDSETGRGGACQKHKKTEIENSSFTYVCTVCVHVYIDWREGTSTAGKQYGI